MLSRARRSTRRKPRPHRIICSRPRGSPSPAATASNDRAPPGLTAIDEAKAPVDVFFIHPTTYGPHDVWNAAIDAAPNKLPLNPVVLSSQLSVFNGCCRLYAPRYRQASLPGNGDRGAMTLAYGDVERAFRYYIAHENHGRPFIIATHSQGTAHGVRLVQREILDTPLAKQMVAAYLIGVYVPSDFTKIGLSICDAPRQTGCVVSWNTGKMDSSLTRKILLAHPTYWWQGDYRDHDQPQAVCVNPLTWRANDAQAPASANTGSLRFPEKPYATQTGPLPALVPNLTGARCHDGLLEVAPPRSAPDGFSDMLTRLLGSYHLHDYGLFYASLRQNAIDRVAQWQADHPATR